MPEAPALARWPDQLLSDMRRVGDPVADGLIEKIFASGDIGRVNELLTTLIRNDNIPAVGLDQDVYEYLRATAAIPDMDAELVREGQEFFRRHGNLALFVLVCASLPECYTMKRGVNVLWLTQRLQEHVLRRLLETAHMVLRVMTPGGIAPGGAGLQAAAKVRLMHAAIRRLILYGAPAGTKTEAAPGFAKVLIDIRWDTEALGYPINQMDLAFTLLTFSYVIPRSMEKLGVTMTPREKDAFIHAWNVIGEVMGIRRELLAGSYAEAQALFERIKALEGAASAAGKEMTGAVIRCLKDAIPGHVFDFLPKLLMRELMDEKTCAMLGIAPPGLLSKMAQKVLAAEIKGAAFIKRETGEHLMLTPIVWNFAAGKIMSYLTNYRQPPGWNRQLFTIPTDLSEHWSVPKLES